MAVNESPRVTIVVPTLGRVKLVAKLIESVRRVSRCDGIKTELCLIDSSPPVERAQLEEICRNTGASLIEGPVSVSDKRNLGAIQAQTEYVFFVDSDCILSPGCLRAHIETLQQNGAQGSGGAVYFEGEENLIFRTVRASGILRAFTPPAAKYIMWAPSANLMVFRDAAVSVGFDSDIGPPGLGGEDVDFGLRFSRYGYTIVGTPAAVVYHSTATWNSILSNTIRFFSWGRSDARLIQRYPNMSFLDVPSPVLVMLSLIVTTAIVSFFSPLVWVSLAIGVTVFATVVVCGGIRQVPNDKLAGMFRYWVFLLLDAGRIFESCRSKAFVAMFFRFRYSYNQFEEEWPDLILGLWANWLMVLATIFLTWLILALQQGV